MKKLLANLKEFVRKSLVSLKRKPQTIALLGLVVAFVYFSFNLTQISNTTAGFQMNGMGLSAFIIMLFSVLVMVCFLNAFPHRKKVNIPMLVLMFIMLGAIIFCNVYYDRCIDQALEMRWNEKYEKHISDANKAIRDAREDAAEAAASAATAAVSAEKAQADADAAAAAAAKTQEIADALSAQTDAGEQAAAAQTAAETAKAAAESAAEGAASAATASGNIATNAAATAEAAAAAEKGETLSDIKAGSKDAASAAKKAKNLAKNVTKAEKKAADGRAAAEEALAAAQAAAEAAGLTLEETAPAEEAQQAAEDNTAAETTSEEAAIELSPALYEAAKKLGDDEVAKTLSKDPSINAAMTVMEVHRIILIVALALVVLLPVYTPLLRKIRTSIEVEENGDMGAIELNGSDE